MSGYLLVVTADGYGKRVRLGELKPTKHARTRGVRLSAAEPAAVLVVGRTGDVMIATAGARLPRLDVDGRHVRNPAVSECLGGRVGLFEGEEATHIRVLGPLRPLAAICAFEDRKFPFL